MPPEEPLPFDKIVKWRQQLVEFCRGHKDSLSAFSHGMSFKLALSDPDFPDEARHLSSTATCLESLLECPQSDDEALAEQVVAFGISAMARPHKKWRSDGSAPIYCRCRTLPLILKCFREDQLLQYKSVLRTHLGIVLKQLKLKDASRLAMGEASGRASDWYPPNAFHTYWTLLIIELIKSNRLFLYYDLEAAFKKTRFDLDRVWSELILWAKHMAGYQMALHSSESSTLDSAQLAWSLAIIMRYDRGLEASLAQQDFIKNGLKCLFGAQTQAGTWRTGAPLFHYKKSGNAYCYVFETFAVLLKTALMPREEAPFLRQAFKEHAGNLISLWQYATRTQIPLDARSTCFGWSSGHRPNPQTAESWATASVYSFCQSLRKLVGIWAREDAAKELRVQKPQKTKQKAIDLIVERGNTWFRKGDTAATQLMTLFVNPRLAAIDNDQLEPDSEPIKDHHARAAILFGPPGTSKTTLSQSVAAAIGWDYVELHSSHFVAEGLPNVQRTADRIFEQLMQLDRTVILFDEIDELVRARDQEDDAFGRFLTTSMLPKLAKLWKGGRVIYFVATNYIRFFDSAVTRAERFDALVHVAPPSFENKKGELTKKLQQHGVLVKEVRFDRETVESELSIISQTADKHKGERRLQKLRSEMLPPECLLASFLLMRYDQMEELAAAIKRVTNGAPEIDLTRDNVAASLLEVSDPFLKTYGPFLDYFDSQRYEQHDFRKDRVWVVEGDIPKGNQIRLLKTGDSNWFVSHAAFGDKDGLPSELEIVPDRVGRLRFLAENKPMPAGDTITSKTP